MKKFKVMLCFLFILFTILSISTNASNIVFAETTNEYNCKSYCLVDYATNKVLKSYKEYEHYEAASMVKLMTCYIAINKIDSGELELSKKIICSEYAASQEGSQAFLDANNEYSIEELLKSIIIASANDSCVAMAEVIAGSETKFVELMNECAKNLGMENTIYANCTGLPAFNQYSCARDIATILSKVSDMELYRKYSSIWMDELVHPSGRKTELVNTNRLVRYYPGCVCGKTGFTDEAGYCLSSCAEKNNMRLISVVMGCNSSEDRFSISTNILNYGFTNFNNKKVVSSEEEIVVDFKGLKEGLKCHSEKDMTVLTEKVSSTELTYKTELNKNIKLPIQKGEVVGKVIVLENGVVVEEGNLVSCEDYKKQGLFSGAKNIFDKWFGKTKEVDF